jgi:hypothetical protein
MVTGATFFLKQSEVAYSPGVAEVVKPVRKPSPHPRASNRWSWIQFFCAFALAALVAFLHIDAPLDGIWLHVIKMVAIAGICGFLAGRFGDAAWNGILRLLSWGS